MLVPGNPRWDQVLFWEVPSCLSARSLVFQSSQGGEEGRKEEMDRRARQPWWSVHADLLCCTSTTFVTLWGEKSCPCTWVGVGGSVTPWWLLYSYTISHVICSWFLLGAGWDGLHRLNVVGNKCIVNSPLKSWESLWGLCRMAGGIGGFHWRLPKERIASFFVSVHPQLSCWDNNSLGKQRNLMQVCHQIWKWKRPVSSVDIRAEGWKGGTLFCLCCATCPLLSCLWSGVKMPTTSAQRRGMKV